MDELIEIKEHISRTLERKNVLSKLKAEIRAHVFVAIDEDELGSGGEGRVVVDLVREFLEWCNLEFTLKVFEPEIGRVTSSNDRGSLLRQLGLPMSADGPVLLTLLREGGPNSVADPDPLPDPPQRSSGGGRPPIVPPLSLENAQKQSLASEGASDPPLQRRLEPITGGVNLHPPQPQMTLQPTHQPPPVTVNKGDSEDSYELEVESDEGLDGVEIVDEDDEEEYAFAPPQAKTKSVSGGGLSASQLPMAPLTGAARSSGGGGAAGDSQEMDESSLSSSSLMLQGGRIRPGRKSKLASDGGSDLGISYGAEPEGGLTLTGDINYSPNNKDSQGSLGGSRDELMKPRGLAPLAPLSGKLAQLAPLAPLGGSRPLKSSGGGAGDDIKDELRRAGLLTLPSGDSYSTHSSVEASGSQQAVASISTKPATRIGGGGVYDAEFSVSNSNIEDVFGAPEQDFGLSIDVGRSMDLREHGLSQTDRSGDLDNMMEGADIAETAEWD